MTQPTPTLPTRAFRACADPTRLRIVHLLDDGELCVCDLVEALGAPQPTVSRHLAYLRRVGLVSVRRNGAWNYYALATPSNGFHTKLLDCVRASAGGDVSARHDAARLRKLRRRLDRCR